MKRGVRAAFTFAFGGWPIWPHPIYLLFFQEEWVI
jgi:hypothetical protein